MRLQHALWAALALVLSVVALMMGATIIAALLVAVPVLILAAALTGHLKVEVRRDR